LGKQGHLVVFVRTPRLGRVKTRLARDIGALQALQAYRAIAFGSLRRLRRHAHWHCWLAIDTHSALSRPCLWPVGWRRIDQGPGDLGRRMASVIRRLPPGPLVICGSDVPGIRAEDIAAAFRLLHQKDFVFGPAMDGGFWLIGIKRRPIPPGLFADVRWSSRHALADTLANTAGHSVGYLELLEDIDSGAALERWRAGALSRRPYAGAILR
jgi:rSAM/selenodomain-associated transferase 1